MAELTITITGVDKLYKKLGGLHNVFLPPMNRATARLQSYMQEYPAKQSTGPIEFKSDRQRRYVMWAIRQGIIKIPYHRRHVLGNSWSTTITVLTNGVIGKVNTGLGYARYVQSAERQAAMHRRNNWRTDAQAVKVNRRIIVMDFERAIKEAIERG